MSRKFVGKLIRIMMTKSSSCDILKKKRTIRRGSGSRPKGSYLMDLRFWNYVIPDGSTTQVVKMVVKIDVLELCHSRWFYYSSDTSRSIALFWNYVIPDGSTTRNCIQRVAILFWNYVIPDGSTTRTPSPPRRAPFWNYVIPDGSTTVLC